MSQHASHPGPTLLRAGVPVELDRPLSELTWYRLGGPAQALVSPRDPAELARVVGLCAEHGWPLRVLGGGANLLVRDAGVPGVVIRLSSPGFQSVEELEGGVLRVGAGHDLMELVQECARRGLAGLECLAGVPGTAGGAVRMNAGGVHGDIGARVAAVQCLGEDGVLREVDRRDLAFGYRHSELPGLMLTRVDLALDREDPVAVRERVKAYFAQKGRSQPMAKHSAGCCFRNPSGAEPAGRLIDLAGLKGSRLGGAEVSEVHANFIVAHGGARADDVVALMDRVRLGVLERFGVALKREVVLWPDEGDLLAPAPVLS